VAIWGEGPPVLYDTLYTTHSTALQSTGLHDTLHRQLSVSIDPPKSHLGNRFHLEDSDVLLLPAVADTGRSESASEYPQW